MNRKSIGKVTRIESTLQTLSTRSRQSTRSSWTQSMEFREQLLVVETLQKRCKLLMLPCSGTTPYILPIILSTWINLRRWEMEEISAVCQTMRSSHTWGTQISKVNLIMKLETSTPQTSLKTEWQLVFAPSSLGDQDIPQLSPTQWKALLQFVPPLENSETEKRH